MTLKIKLRRSFMLPLSSSMFLVLPLLLTAVFLLAEPIQAKQDLRESIISGTEPCFRYTLANNLFYINCSVLYWKSEGYGPDTYISLSANEIFDGRTEDNRESFIDLSGINNFDGLFTINDTEVTTFADAPLIRNVHVRNGTVAEWGGFIVQEKQKYFIIDSCSSTGDITFAAGGISGSKSGLNYGEIKISNSYSTGKITGAEDSGGITGFGVGSNGGIANIAQCYSTGNIEGAGGGGICGDDPGSTNGKVYIRQCYSTGDIVSDHSGGIVGNEAGFDGGYVHVQECYHTGQINARLSGGICGSAAANSAGEVHIRDCYSRGDIDGEFAGGIIGSTTGGTLDEGYGDVYIDNTYASGIVKHKNGGGIVGRIEADFEGHTIHVQYSVYNNNTEAQRNIVGKDNGNHLEGTGNSDSLDDIRGELYHDDDGIQRWDNDIWVVNGTDTLPILHFQLMESVPIPIPSPLISRRRILPVQRAPRSVKQRSSQAKRRRTFS